MDVQFPPPPDLGHILDLYVIVLLRLLFGAYDSKYCNAILSSLQVLPF